MSSTPIVNMTPAPRGWTLSDLKTAMAAQFSDLSSAFASELTFYLNAVIRDIMGRHDWRWLHSASSFTTIGGQAEYGLEPDVAFLDGGCLTIQGEPPILETTLLKLRGLQATYSSDTQSLTGTPRWFARTGDATVVLHPLRDAGAVVLYDYTRKIADLSEDTDPLPMPTQYQNMVLNGLRYYLRDKDNRFDSATALAKSAFEQSIGDMIWRELNGVEYVITGDIAAGE